MAIYEIYFNERILKKYKDYFYDDLKSDKYVSKFNDVFNLYITKEYLKYYKDILIDVFKVYEFKEYNLYCDFTDDKNLIRELENNIIKDNKKFDNVYENKDNLLNKILIDIIILLFKKDSQYFDNLKIFRDVIGGFYLDSYFKDNLISINDDAISLLLSYVSNDSLTIKDLLYKFFSENKTNIILKIPKNYKFNVDDFISNNFMGILKNYDNSIEYDGNLTFIGMFVKYLNNPEDFNKTYKDIKYYSYIDIFSMHSLYFMDKQERNKKLFSFLEEIKLDTKTIDFIKNIKTNNSEIFINKNTPEFNYILNEYVNKDKIFQSIIINALLIRNNVSHTNIYFYINFLDYIEYKDKLLNNLNILYYIDAFFTKNKNISKHLYDSEDFEYLEDTKGFYYLSPTPFFNNCMDTIINNSNYYVILKCFDKFLEGYFNRFSNLILMKIL